MKKIDQNGIKLYEEWLNNKRSGMKRSKYSPVTINIYMTSIKHILKCMDYTIDDPNLWLEYYNRCVEKNKPMYYAIISFLKFISDGMIDVDIIKDIRKRLIPPNENYNPKRIQIDISDKQAIEILNHMHNEYRYISIIQYCTGLRFSSVAHLKYNDFKWRFISNGWALQINAMVTKTGRVHTTWITNEFADCVGDFIGLPKPTEEFVDIDGNVISKDSIISLRNKKSIGHITDDYVFLSLLYKKNKEKDLSVYVRSLYQRYYKALRKASIKIGLIDNNNGDIKLSFGSHGWRSNLGRKVYSRDNSIIDVKEVLGHSSIETSIRYAKKAALTSHTLLKNIQPSVDI